MAYDIDLPPTSPTNVKLAKSVTQENDGDEEEQIHGRANHWLPQAGRGGHPTFGRNGRKALAIRTPSALIKVQATDTQHGQMLAA